MELIGKYIQIVRVADDLGTQKGLMISPQLYRKYIKPRQKEFGGKLGFWGGGCDTQQILPYETPKNVEKEVKKRIRDFAPGGGFVFASIHNIQYDVPPENICKLFDTVLKIGKYPIKKHKFH